MSNHLHLALQVADAPLGPIVRRIAGVYARRIQQRLPTTGHLFERRYRSVLVDADTHLLRLVRYIHLNPLRAGLVADPADYPWSGHRAYLGLSLGSVAHDRLHVAAAWNESEQRATRVREVDRSGRRPGRLGAVQPRHAGGYAGARGRWISCKGHGHPQAGFTNEPLSSDAGATIVAASKEIGCTIGTWLCSSSRGCCRPRSLRHAGWRAASRGAARAPAD